MCGSGIGRSPVATTGDPAVCGPEIIAAYFPAAKAVIEQVLCEQGLRPDQVDVVIPTGVSHASWDILLRLAGIPERPSATAVVPSFGHTMTSDSFVFLRRFGALAHVPRGSRLLLFTYGFGSSWCGLLLEH